MSDRSEAARAETAVRRDGVYRWNGFLSGGRLRQIVASCQRLLAGNDVEIQSRSLRVWNLFAHDTEFRDLLLDTRLTSVCAALLGAGHLLSDYSLNAPYPGAAEDPWHVDYPYNEALAPVWSTAPLGLQCILAVDAFDQANGATGFVARSHRLAADEGGDEDRPRVERFDAEPGDLLIMHARTWHRAGLNTTIEPRAGVVLSFVQRWIRPIISPRDVAAAVDEDMPEELRVLLGAVVYEEIDARVVRREVL